jgi:hypothetical protein
VQPFLVITFAKVFLIVSVSNIAFILVKGLQAEEPMENQVQIANNLPLNLRLQ